MPDWLFPLITASWLGILTSISPCPLATNIAAVSFISKKIDKPKDVFFTGFLYTLGRILTYVILGVILLNSLMSAPIVAHVLQKYMNMALGPIMLFVGLILLNIITFNIKGFSINDKIQAKAESLGIWGGGLLGIIFALSFCPTSAALFFGSLFPLALEKESSILLPTLYGIGTGLPVLFFAILLSLGTQKIGKAYNLITSFDKWARRITGIIFIGIGIYFTLLYTFKLNLFN